MVQKQLIFVLALVLVAQCAADDHHQDEALLTKSQIWGFGFLAGLGISLLGFIAAIVLVLVKKCISEKTFEATLKFLFSLACGALLGDAIVHIVAESYANEETNNAIVSLIFILAILVFMFIDRAFHAFGISHSHWVGQVCENENEHKEKKNCKGGQEMCEEGEYNHKGHVCEGILKREVIRVQAIESSEKIEETPETKRKEEEKEDQKAKGCLSQFKGKGSNGYINLIGSTIHNFIDGLALGISFSTGDPGVFVPVLVAIIAHEIPRQLGDVAILLKSEFSTIQTVMCNGTANLLSLVGVFVGLAIVNLSEVVKAYIMIFVAGNFLYVAADIWRNILKNTNSRTQNLVEFIGLALGIGSMFALLAFEQGEEHNH